ncbi:MAG: magnesium chelatase, partial [Chloroflexales bacterium]|nr:magnesium chelatase [Chloroflexales bacterium]
DFRNVVGEEDLRRVAPLALRQRNSARIEEYGRQHAEERATIEAALAALAPAPAPAPRRGKGSTMRRIEGEGA